MADLEIRIPCIVCNGTKVQELRNNLNEIIGTKPCESCNAVGYQISSKADITDIMNKLDYIHGKVTAIGNKVKDK